MTSGTTSRRGKGLGNLFADHNTRPQVKVDKHSRRTCTSRIIIYGQRDRFTPFTWYILKPRLLSYLKYFKQFANIGERAQCESHVNNKDQREPNDVWRYISELVL